MRRALTIGLVLAVAGVLGVAGCGAPGASPAPGTEASTSSRPTSPSTTSPTAATTPTPTPTPTPTATTPPPFIPGRPPADATTPPRTPPVTTLPATPIPYDPHTERDPNRPTEDEISAFAVYALQLFPYVFATGDQAAWAAISHPDCNYCREVGDDLAAAVAAGGYSEGGLIDVTWATSIDWQDFWQVRFTMTQGSSTDFAADGAVVDEWGGHTSYGEMRVVTNGGQLQVAGFVTATAQRLDGQAVPLPMDQLPVTTDKIDEPWWSAAMSTMIRYSLTHAYARATGDIAPLEALSTADCEECAALAADVVATPDAERPAGSRVMFTGMEVPSWMESQLWALTSLEIVEFPAPVRWFPGSDLGKARSPVHWIYTLAVEYHDGRWQVTWADVTRGHARSTVRVPFDPGVERGPCDDPTCPRAI
jgi:hypothetical protein